MRIYLCTNCGQIGNEAHFQIAAPIVELDPAMAKIVQANGFRAATAPICPFCKSVRLFYKDVADLYISGGVQTSPPANSITFPQPEKKLARDLPEVSITLDEKLLQPATVKSAPALVAEPAADDSDIDDKLLA